MNLVAKFIAFFNNFFRVCAMHSRPAWEFRIRMSLEKRKWVIELHENGDQRWHPLTKLDETTDGELHVHKFESYQEAYQFVTTSGLHLAYEQFHYTHNRKPLHPAASAAEHAVLEASASTMAVGFSKVRPIAEVRQLGSHR